MLNAITSFQKVYFGENEYIVILTGREHFNAHLMLWMYYKEKYGVEDTKYRKMSDAFWLMCHTRKDTKIKLNCLTYEFLREERTEIRRTAWVGENNPNSYKHLSLEEQLIIRERLKINTAKQMKAVLRCNIETL